MDRHHLDDIRRATLAVIAESQGGNPRTDAIFDALKRRAISEPATGDALNDLEQNHHHADTRASALRYFARHVLAVLRNEGLLEQQDLEGRVGNPSHHYRWALTDRGRERVNRAITFERPPMVTLLLPAPVAVQLREALDAVL